MIIVVIVHDLFVGGLCDLRNVFEQLVISISRDGENQE